MPAKKINNLLITGTTYNVSEFQRAIDQQIHGVESATLQNGAGGEEIYKSIIYEYSGAIYEFFTVSWPSDESIIISIIDPYTGDIALDGVVYFMVSADSDSSINLTNTPPVYDSARGGWYGVAPYGYSRYLNYAADYISFALSDFRPLLKNNEFVVEGFDATERSITSITPTIENNLIITIPINSGEVWKVELEGFYKGTASLIGHGETHISLESYSGDSIVTSPVEIVAAILPSASDNDFPYLIVDAINYQTQKSLITSYVQGLKSENLQVAMKWRSAGGGSLPVQTSYCKERYMRAYRVV